MCGRQEGFRLLNVLMISSNEKNTRSAVCKCLSVVRFCWCSKEDKRRASAWSDGKGPWEGHPKDNSELDDEHTDHVQNLISISSLWQVIKKVSAPVTVYFMQISRDSVLSLAESLSDPPRIAR